MKITIITAGKAHDNDLKAAIEDFSKRIEKYFPFNWLILSTKQYNVSAEQKKFESGIILSQITKDDFVILLDERGKQFSSVEVADLIQQTANASKKRIVLIIGGAYGVEQSVFERANIIWSLSKLVFPHQLVRLILAEQLYRACTIMRNEKYHHI